MDIHACYLYRVKESLHDMRMCLLGRSCVDIGHFGTERPSACGIMSLEETVKGLHAASEYLVRTKGLVSGETFEQVEEQQCRAWVSNIQKLRITEVTDSTEVMETISSSLQVHGRMPANNAFSRRLRKEASREGERRAPSSRAWLTGWPI